MTHKHLIDALYSAFNQRDIDGALALMVADVSWPKASEGGRVVGRDEIRAYWSRQWQDFDPYVMPTEVSDDGSGRLRVRVHQIVRDRSGQVLSDGEVWHIYTMLDGLVGRMDLGQSDSEASPAPSAAFTPPGRRL